MFEYFIGMFKDDEFLKAYLIKARLSVQAG
jgi:hypothetical protein